MEQKQPTKNEQSLDEGRFIQTDTEVPKDLNKSKVTYLACFFMCLLISLNSYFQYSSYVFNQLNYSKMGMISVAAFFMASAIGTLYAPWFSRAYFSKYSMKFLAAALPHVLLILTGVLASACSENEGNIACSAFSLYTLVSISSIACGLGNALLWVLQGAYITDCTSPTNKGEFFGIFLQISYACNIVGPLLSSYLFKNYGTTGYFIVMSGLTLVSTSMALLVKQPELVSTYTIVQLRKESEYDERTGQDFMYYKALNKDLGHNQESNTDTNENHTQDVLDLSKLKGFIREQYQIKYYFSVFFLNGFFLGYYWSQMGFIAGEKLDGQTSSEKNEKMGFLYLVMGGIQIILGRKMGTSFDQVDQKIIFYKRLVLCTALSMLLMLLAHFLPFFSPFYLINMLFGVSELIIKTFIGGVLSLKFPENSYESFATYRFVSNLASGVAMIISSLFTPEVPLVLMISVFLNIFACYRSTNDIKRHLDMPPDALLMSSTSR